MIACMHHHYMSWLSPFSSEFIQSLSNFRATEMNMTKIRYDSLYYLLQYWNPETSPNSSLYKQASAEMTVQLLVQLGTQECSPPTHLWCGNDTVNNTDGWQIVLILDPQLHYMFKTQKSWRLFSIRNIDDACVTANQGQTISSIQMCHGIKHKIQTYNIKLVDIVPKRTLESITLFSGTQGRGVGW